MRAERGIAQQPALQRGRARIQPRQAGQRQPRLRGPADGVGLGPSRLQQAWHLQPALGTQRARHARPAPLGTIGGSLASALADPKTREASLITFLAATANIKLSGIGGAFWGLVIGLLAHAALNGRLPQRIRPPRYTLICRAPNPPARTW